MVGLILILIFAVPAVIVWIVGVDMIKQQRDYDKRKSSIDWDDNKIHSEGDF